jgi:hypothetical protein
MEQLAFVHGVLQVYKDKHQIISAVVASERNWLGYALHLIPVNASEGNWLGYAPHLVPVSAHALWHLFNNAYRCGMA